jgi:hypothetical protein
LSNDSLHRHGLLRSELPVPVITINFELSCNTATPCRQTVQLLQMCRLQTIPKFSSTVTPQVWRWSGARQRAQPGTPQFGIRRPTSRRRVVGSPCRWRWRHDSEFVFPRVSMLHIKALTPERNVSTRAHCKGCAGSSAHLLLAIS